MQSYVTPFGLGPVVGMRNMAACAALAWAASKDRTHGNLIQSGPTARTLATAVVVAEMAGDKMPFAPDRRIPPSFAIRLVIGAVGGWALAGRNATPTTGALAGAAGAIAGTLLDRSTRGDDNQSPSGLARWLAEDMVAAGLAVAVVSLADARVNAALVERLDPRRRNPPT